MKTAKHCSKLYVPFDQITPAEVCRLNDCIVDGDEHAVIIKIGGENWHDGYSASRFKLLAASLQRERL
jgi:hypothetical protein